MSATRTSKASTSSSETWTFSRELLPWQPETVDWLLTVSSEVKLRPSSLPYLADQLLREARRYGQVTPLQVALLYQLCDLEHRRGSISISDFKKLLPRPSFSVYPPVSMETTSTDSSEQVCVCVCVCSIWVCVTRRRRFLCGSSLWSHCIGSLSAPLVEVCALVCGVRGQFPLTATGATVVYPIDLVKTRMQNQRGSLPGEIMYRNSLDCFVKVVRNEGLLGLYRGKPGPPGRI